MKKNCERQIHDIHETWSKLKPNQIRKARSIVNEASESHSEFCCYKTDRKCFMFETNIEMFQRQFELRLNAFIAFITFIAYR